MRVLFFFGFLLFCLTANGQVDIEEKIEQVEITDERIHPLDFHVLDVHFEKAKVVGIGEATHGTHEFQRTYLELFQFLVEHHGFNTLFIEDEFSRCLQLDNALRSSGAEKIELTQLSNWPFITEEILALMNWIAKYNTENRNKQISIVGVDMQDAYHINQTLNKILSLCHLQGTDLFKPGGISKEKHRRRQNKKLSSKERIAFYKRLVPQIHVEYKFVYQHLIEQLEYNRLMVKHPKRTIRDLAMGKNVLTILEKSPESKGMFIAHNAHLAKVNLKRKNELKNRTYAGGILDKYLGKEYFAILQDFDSGCFMAYNHLGGSKKSISSYKKQSVCIEEGVENSFGSVLRARKDVNPIYLIEELYRQRNLQNVKFHNIGAVFYPDKENKNQTTQYFELTNTKFFDALIFHEITTPTTLIKSLP